MERDERSAKPMEPEWVHYTGAVRGLVMANSLLAFALELAMFVFVGWWALSLDLALWLRLLTAAASVTALAVLWGAFAAPKARVRLPVAGVVAVKAVAFGAGAVALWGAGHPLPALAFAVLAAVNTVFVTFARSNGPLRSESR